MRRWLSLRQRRFLRVALSYYVLNGASCALGLFLVSSTVMLLFGTEAAAVATVGVIATLAPDMVGPRRGKLAHMVVGPVIGVPLFAAVLALEGKTLELGLFLVPATFVVFLGMAWGKRGAPVAIGVMLALVFAMSLPPASGTEQVLLRTLYCGLGAALYVVYSVIANSVLNGRYRTQLTADLLLAVSALLQAHARRVSPRADGAPGPGEVAPDSAAGLTELLKRQAALADQLQSTRDVVLESPNTPRRQRLAGMLLVVLEMRDHLVASELDLDRVREAADHAHALEEIAAIYRQMARELAFLADDLLLRRRPPVATDHSARLAALRLREEPASADLSADPTGAAQAALLRGVSFRIEHQNDAVRQLSLLARGETMPDLAVVRNSWRLFVSPTDWSLQPFLTVWHWRQPALRHAVRAALAVGTGYTVAVLLPWGSHAYWILLTIVVVLRGSLAQTLERRNQRVAGTLVGSLLATGLLALHPPALLLLIAVTVSQGIAHGFAMRRYVVTAMAASVMGLVQAHLLFAGSNATFAFFERVGDTLLGAGIAWAFAYVLPSWERGQLTGLVRRVLKALDQHARQSLSLAQVEAIDTQSELTWRLARREAYDALSALVQATARALVEPRAVQPPLALLEQLQGHSYQLLGQLSAIKSLMLLRRERLQLDGLTVPLEQAAAVIEQTLAFDRVSTAAHSLDTARVDLDVSLPAVPETLPDPYLQDASPWLLRRLNLSEALARRVRADAAGVLAELEVAGAARP
ncbi:FUSC family protein [Ottowia sp. GY511]|nr:FUSC family protein [Ottowia sp. GY511]